MTSGTNSAQAQVGVIGGSGLYRFLEHAREVRVQTPFGSPSEQPLIADVDGRAVAFIPRHGRDHRLPPHQVNYRANLWALRALGVRQVFGPCAVGSMLPELGPGSLVLPDQVIDRTWGREHTVYDGLSGKPGVVHVAFADPYCRRGRAAVLAAARAQDWPPRDGATLVIVNGPRFSSRAESRWHAASGGHVIGMTGMPEAAIARELAMCYTAIAVVTDLDAGVEAGAGVTQAEVLEVFAASSRRLVSVLTDAVSRLPTDGDCACRHSLDGLVLPWPLP